MKFTVNTIAKSLAEYLKPLLPEYTFIENPAQGGIITPCLFLQQRYSNIELQTGGFYKRRIGLDLTCLQDYNLPDLQQLYEATAEILDLALENFPYNDGENSRDVLIKTHNREWNIDLDALHYKFDIEERVIIPKKNIKMQTIQELNEEVKLK